MNHIQNSLEYSHKERDPGDNAKTSLPPDESLRVPCIWAFEAFTPTLIDNLWDGARRLQGSESSLGAQEPFADLVADWRLRARGGGWVNLGFIVNPEQYRPIEHTLTARLPTGVKAVHATILQPLPSTTILCSQFIFDEQGRSALEAPLREVFSTYAENREKGIVSFISVEHQRIQAVEVMRAYLRGQCTDWLANTFPGLWASGGASAIPTVELMLFSKRDEFENRTPRNANESSVLNVLRLDTPFETWKSDELPGLYLKLDGSTKNSPGRAVLFGNIESALRGTDLAAYGSQREDQIAHWCQDLDHTFGVWILGLIADSYVRDLATVRDGYGSLQFDATAESLTSARRLETTVSALTRNSMPFAYELKQYCRRKSLFMHEIYEFDPVTKWPGVERKLFANMRENLILVARHIKDVEQHVRTVAIQFGQIVSAMANERLGSTNLKLQRAIAWMTIAILVLTALLAKKEISEVGELFEKAIAAFRGA